MNTLPFAMPALAIKRSFDLGTVTITPKALNRLESKEIVDALQRHCECNFGDVPYETYIAFLSMIAEHRGSVVSVNTSSNGFKFAIRTRLDEFEPLTIISEY